MVASALHQAGRLEDALALIREGRRTIPDDTALEWRGVRYLAALGRAEAFDSMLAVISPARWPEGSWSRMYLIGVAADEAAVHGQDLLATALYERLIAWVESRAADERTPNQRGWLAWALYLTGRHAEADTLYARLTAEADSRWKYFFMGLRGAVLADMGRADEARDLSEQIASTALATDTSAVIMRERFEGRARIAAALGDRDATVEFVRQMLEAQFVGRRTFHSDPQWRELWGYPPWDALWGVR
jgi:tetratricopeptide (TPR) repeat protein